MSIPKFGVLENLQKTLAEKTNDIIPSATELTHLKDNVTARLEGLSSVAEKTISPIVSDIAELVTDGSIDNAVNSLGAVVANNATSIKDAGKIITDKIKIRERSKILDVVRKVVGPTGGPAVVIEMTKSFRPAKEEDKPDNATESPKKNKKFPNVLPNPLNEFVSCNYVISLGVLNPYEVSRPDDTYIKNGPTTYIIKSGGGNLGKSGVRTIFEATLSSSNIDGDDTGTEFFIEDLEIDAICTPNNKTHMQTQGTMSFKVIEPYSMGQFLEALQIGAEQSGYAHYLDAVYVFCIDWVGSDETGATKRFSDLSYTRTKTLKGGAGKQTVKETEYSHRRRYIPIKLMTASFSVTGGGAEYSVNAVSSNDEAMRASIQRLPVDITVAGDTVSEMLQTGPKSLTNGINSHLLSRRSQDPHKYADEFIIMFPRDDARDSKQVGEQLGTNPNNEEENQAVENLDNQEEKKKFIARGHKETNWDTWKKTNAGIALQRGDKSTKLKENASDEKLNAIGKSKVSEDKLSAQAQIVQQEDLVQKETQNYGQRPDMSKIQHEADKKAIVFKQGTHITRVIEEVVLSSAWARGLRDQPADKDGNKIWFRIENNLHFVPVKEVVDTHGQMPKLYIFRVVHYKVHESVFQKVTSISKGKDEIIKKVVKEFNYIYTGKNKDVINFNIDYQHRFQTRFPADDGGATSHIQNQGDHAKKIQLDNIDSNTKKAEGTGGLGISDKKMAQIQRNISGIGSVKSSVAKGLNGAMTDLDKMNQHANPPLVKRLADATFTNFTSGIRAVPAGQKDTIARTFHEATLNLGADMMVVELEIWGDPYFISDSGHGNYNSKSEQDSYIDGSGQMTYQDKQVWIAVEFRTPFDIGSDGIMNFPTNYTDGKVVQHFSGIYRITKVVSTFSKGTFKQTLHLIRLGHQDGKADSEDNSAAGSGKKTDGEAK